MKRFILPIMLLSFSSFLYSQSANEQAVKKTLETFLLAMKKNDAGTATSLLADDYKMDGHSGITCITNKTQRLSSIQSGQIKYDTVNFENLQNHLYISDTAAYILAVTTTITVKSCNETGKEYTHRGLALSFAKKEGHWLLSSECIGRNCWR